MIGEKLGRLITRQVKLGNESGKHKHGPRRARPGLDSLVPYGSVISHHRLELKLIPDYGPGVLTLKT